MRSFPAFTLIGFFGFFLAAHAAAQREVARPALTPAAGASSALSDVASSYDRMEANLEQEYAKLMGDARAQKQALEDKIKEIDRQIAALKDQARKIEEVAKKLEQLLPKIMAGLGSDSGGMRRTPSAKSGQLAALLASERAKAGLPSTPGFPSLTPADFSNAVALGRSNGAAFLSSRIGQQASQKIAEIDDAVAAKKKASASLKSQIAELDKQLAKLAEEKQKALAGLRKQKEKAVAEAAKAQDARQIRLPTSTSTPAPVKR